MGTRTSWRICVVALTVAMAGTAVAAGSWGPRPDVDVLAVFEP